MENTIKRLLAMSILLVGLAANAENVDPKPVMEVMSVNEDSFLLVMSDVTNKISLVINDQYGFVLYAEQLTPGKKYKKTYNISSLPEGNYFIQILDDDFSKTYSMSKGNNRMVIKVNFPTQILDDHSMLAVSMN